MLFSVSMKYYNTNADKWKNAWSVLEKGHDEAVKKDTDHKEKKYRN